MRQIKFQINIRQSMFFVFVVALILWWLMWPVRTFNRFIFQLEQGDYQLALSMVSQSEDTLVSIGSSGVQIVDHREGGAGSELIAGDLVRSFYRIEPRSLVDIVLSQRRYRCREIAYGGEVFKIEPSPFQFIASRGKIYVSVEEQ